MDRSFSRYAYACALLPTPSPSSNHRLQEALAAGSSHELPQLFQVLQVPPSPLISPSALSNHQLCYNSLVIVFSRPCSVHSVALQRVPCLRCMVSRPARCRSCPPAASAASPPSSTPPMQRVPVLQSACSREHAHCPCSLPHCDAAAARAVDLLSSTCAQLPPDFFLQSCKDDAALLMARALVASTRSDAASFHTYALECRLNRITCSATRFYRAAGCASKPCSCPTASALAP